jgi:hypothetical protein
MSRGNLSRNYERGANSQRFALPAGARTQEHNFIQNLQIEARPAPCRVHAVLGFVFLIWNLLDDKTIMGNTK